MTKTSRHLNIYYALNANGKPNNPVYGLRSSKSIAFILKNLSQRNGTIYPANASRNRLMTIADYVEGTFREEASNANV